MIESLGREGVLRASSSLRRVRRGEDAAVVPARLQDPVFARQRHYRGRIGDRRDPL